MTDPFKSLTEFQTAWWRACLASSQSMGKLFQHFLDMQQNFLAHAVKYQRSHIEIATGASLTDKYGKRLHDIDPERDV